MAAEGFGLTELQLFLSEVFMTPATLDNFICSFKFTPPAYPGASVAVPIVEKLGFTDLQNVHVYQNSYTPKNDYQYLWQAIPAAQAPNFIICLCSKPIVMTIGCSLGYLVAAMPVNKFGLYLLPQNSPCAITYAYIEGRTNVGLAPMEQNVEVDYMTIFGQGLIT